MSISISYNWLLNFVFLCSSYFQRGNAVCHVCMWRSWCWWWWLATAGTTTSRRLARCFQISPQLLSLPTRMQSHTGYICLTFFHCVLWNVHVTQLMVEVAGHSEQQTPSGVPYSLPGPACNCIQRKAWKTFKLPHPAFIIAFSFVIQLDKF